MCLLVAAPPAAATLTPVGVWHMDEARGARQMRDSSGFNNHGRIGSVDTGLTGPDAFMGAAYRFKGSKGSLVEVPSSPSLVPGTALFMAQVHAKFSKPPMSSYDLIRKGLSTTSGGDFKMEIRSGGTARCHYVTASGPGDIRSKASLADGRWHRIACVKTPTELKLIVDGKTYRKSTKTGPIANNAKIAIGAKNASEDLFAGLLDEVSFWIDR